MRLPEKDQEVISLDWLRSLAQEQDPAVIQDELSVARAEDIAYGIARLNDEEALHILTRMDPDTAGYVVNELPTETARDLLADLPDELVAHYLDALPMDDAIEFREELGEERFNFLLNLIPAEDASELRLLLTYDEDTVGRVMTQRFFEANPEQTMAEVLADIRRASKEKYETINDIYVLDESRHVQGVFSIRRAIRAGLDELAQDLMRKEVVTCYADDQAEDAARTMSRYGFYAMPVLDERARMVGIFTSDDAQAILTEAETADVLALGAVSGTPEAYLSLSVFRLAWKRLPWLFGLFIAETLTGAVLRHYGSSANNELAISPITYFIPLLIGAGGNAGSQVTTMVTRGLAVGEIKVNDFATVVLREFLTALLVGSVLGATGLIRARLWRTDWDLCFVVGLALPCIVIWAATIGSMLPLVAKRLGIDPAVMSAPFISTFVDATGLIIYFEIALAMMGHLRL